MKILLAFAVLLTAQVSFASTLNCKGKTARVQAEFDGRAKLFRNVVVGSEYGVKTYPSAEYDSSYRSRQPNDDKVMYRVMARTNVRSGLGLVLPRAKGRGPFQGILTGRDNGYHGETSYDFMTCVLEY
ncbi:MAG: hypothetical protein ABL958_00170 [Bdellovibrionia bacterium]